MSITSLVRPLFTLRQKSLEKSELLADDRQRQTLERLTVRAADTEWGKRYLYESIQSYDDFALRVPLSTYDDLKEDIDRMRRGERDVLWRGAVRWYAKSSGTTSDRSKFIPVSRDGLRDTHYAGGFDAVAYYLRNYPKSRIFDGKSLILGGSHAPSCNLPGTLTGDLSAILIENIHPLANLVRVPQKQTALLADFEEKRERIAREVVGQRVTNLSGVPSWMLSVLHRALEVSGKQSVSDVWDSLEVFFHGGVAFTPYRELYKALIPNPEMRYMETYNASEGFFGLQNDPADPSLLLMTDYGVFYEFIPLEESHRPVPAILPLWEIEPHRPYELVISTSSGLWRYRIGDTVRFTSVRPYKFVITGRTKSFINAFGEELVVDNAEQGLAYACRETGAIVLEYTAAPVFMDRQGRCRHQWLIEFAKAPASMQAFERLLDEQLQQLNSDYEAKRYKDITLQQLEVKVARPALFTDWLKQKGKLGGQHKVPRLSNTRTCIDELLHLNESAV